MEKYLQVDEFKIKVKIVDARIIFGRTESLVVPIEGSGEKWVQTDRLLPVHKIKPIQP